MGIHIHIFLAITRHNTLHSIGHNNARRRITPTQRNIVLQLITYILTMALMAVSTQKTTAETKKENKKKHTVTLYGQVYDLFAHGKEQAPVTLMNTDVTTANTVMCSNQGHNLVSGSTSCSPSYVTSHAAPAALPQQ